MKHPWIQFEWLPRVFLVLLAARISSLGSTTVEDIYAILRERSVSFDTNVLARSAAEGVAKAVDPRAELLGPTEADAKREMQTIESAEEWSEGIFYLKLRGLYSGGGTEVAARVADWWSGGHRSGLIFDIRGAGGDDLDSVDRIAGMCVTTNTVLYTLRNGAGQTLETRRPKNGGMLLRILPMMLLVDGRTADASEALASSLKGKPGVMLLGSKTLGDTAAREFVPVSEQDLLYIAVKWVVPAGGADYYHTGVEPDIPVSTSADPVQPPVPPDENAGHRPLSEKARVDRDLMRRVVGDAVLRRATDILLGLKALGLNGTENTTNTASSAGL